MSLTALDHTREGQGRPTIVFVHGFGCARSAATRAGGETEQRDRDRGECSLHSATSPTGSRPVCHSPISQMMPTPRASTSIEARSLLPAQKAIEVPLPAEPGLS